MAQPFDPERLVLAGAPFPVAEQIQVFVSYGFFSASDSGVLTYQTGMVAGNAPQLAWLDRSGKVLETIGKPSMYGELALAPDGRRAMVSLLGGQGQGPGDLWLLDLERDGLASRFTFDPANGSPLWSPAGERVVFSSARKGNNDLYQKMSNGAGNDEPLLITNEDKSRNELVSRRAASVVYADCQRPSDIWVLPMRRRRKAFSLFADAGGRISGQILARRPLGRVFIQRVRTAGSVRDAVRWLGSGFRREMPGFQRAVATSPAGVPTARRSFISARLPTCG